MFRGKYKRVDSLWPRDTLRNQNDKDTRLRKFQMTGNFYIFNWPGAVLGFSKRRLTETKAGTSWIFETRKNRFIFPAMTSIHSIHLSGGEAPPPKKKTGLAIDMKLPRVNLSQIATRITGVFFCFKIKEKNIKVTTAYFYFWLFMKYFMQCLEDYKKWSQITTSFLTFTSWKKWFPRN